MCGGSPQPATIVAPDQNAYGQLAMDQINLMQSQQNAGIQQKQGVLDSAIQTQQTTLQQLRDVSLTRANDVSAQAARLAALMGPPPPDKAAVAPVVGNNRAGQERAAGKKGLRIQRSEATTQGPGAGLNISGGY